MYVCQCVWDRRAASSELSLDQTEKWPPFDSRTAFGTFHNEYPVRLILDIKTVVHAGKPVFMANIYEQTGLYPNWKVQFLDTTYTTVLGLKIQIQDNFIQLTLTVDTRISPEYH